MTDPENSYETANAALGEGQQTPQTAQATSRNNPWPVHLFSENLKAYIDRAPYCWIEGEIIEINHRATAAYITLRDLNQEVSLSFQAWSNVIDQTENSLERGSHVVIYSKPNYWLKTGRLSMQAQEIHSVGLGELLTRIERLRTSLAAEGLFDTEHKKLLPFLPQKIGVITGKNSDARKDIVKNTKARWPGVNFEFLEVATQGSRAVSEVTNALQTFDANEEIDVIIIARGGGSVEDLLPFSDESLVRSVFDASTPVVSAIGHEADNPILDNVADFRASTPTDAAKTIVPDVQEERSILKGIQNYAHRIVETRISRELERLSYVRSLSYFARPENIILERASELDRLKEKIHAQFRDFLWQESMHLDSLSTSLQTLSPENTLKRGYAVIRSAQGEIIADAQQTSTGQSLSATLYRGSLELSVDSIHVAGTPDLSDSTA